MGIDLKVMASHFRERSGELLSTATLRFDRDQRILAQFGASAVPCIAHSLPAGLKVGTYEESGLVFTEMDAYRKPLTFTTSSEVANIAIPEDTHPWNVAILAFLRALPPDCKIILFWC